MSTRLFEIDDKVTVTGNAWSRKLGANSRERVPQRMHGRLIKYKVVGHGKFPIDNVSANTLIMNLEFGTFFAINECNLHKSIVDIGICFVVEGCDVTAKLSDESKKAVLAAHLEAGQ